MGDEFLNALCTLDVCTKEINSFSEAQYVIFYLAKIERFKVDSSYLYRDYERKIALAKYWYLCVRKS